MNIIPAIREVARKILHRHQWHLVYMGKVDHGVSWREVAGYGTAFSPSTYRTVHVNGPVYIEVRCCACNVYTLSIVTSLGVAPYEERYARAMLIENLKDTGYDGDFDDWLIDKISSIRDRQ
jgi:hypothetical protein